jgi:uncharacterized coiled-coil protein SlyX
LWTQGDEQQIGGEPLRTNSVSRRTISRLEREVAAQTKLIGELREDIRYMDRAIDQTAERLQDLIEMLGVDAEQDGPEPASLPSWILRSA